MGLAPSSSTEFWCLHIRPSSPEEVSLGTLHMGFADLSDIPHDAEDYSTCYPEVIPTHSPLQKSCWVQTYPVRWVPPGSLDVWLGQISKKNTPFMVLSPRLVKFMSLLGPGQDQGVFWSVACMFSIMRKTNTNQAGHLSHILKSYEITEKKL